MKCRFEVAVVNGVPLAILPCQKEDEFLGLLLHPSPNDQIHGSSSQIYYVSWPFRLPNVSGYRAFRVACLGRDAHNLQFRGESVAATWRDIYIMAHPQTAAGWGDSANLLQGFLPDIAPTAFRIPRTLLQTLGSLEFFTTTRMVFSDPASNDAMSFWCGSTIFLESFCVLLGTCTKVPIKARPCHWAWSEYRCHATWNKLPTRYAHDCAADHIENWPNRMREFGDPERTVRLVFAPCVHAPERTLVLGIELSGIVYVDIQQNAKIYLPQAIPYSDWHVDVLVPRVDLPRPIEGLSFTSIPIYSGDGPYISRIQTADRLSEASSTQTLAEDLEDRPIASPMLAGLGRTHIVAAPVGGSVAHSVADIKSNLYEALQQLRENNAARDREIQEMKDAYNGKIHMLTEALESQRAEFAQLKALITQVPQNNGAIVGSAASGHP